MGRNGDTIYSRMWRRFIHKFGAQTIIILANNFHSGRLLCHRVCNEFNVFTSCLNIYCYCELETIESELRSRGIFYVNNVYVFNIYVNLSGSNHLFVPPLASTRWDCRFGLRSAHMPRLRFGQRQNSFETVIMICVCLCLEGKAIQFKIAERTAVAAVTTMNNENCDV